MSVFRPAQPRQLGEQTFDTNMRGEDEVSTVLSLVAKGLNDGQIARAAGIPRRTVLDWRQGRLPKRAKRSHCDLCLGKNPRLPERDYSYLLGLYLGDGCISESPRSYRIRITLDAAYPGIVDACASALEAILPEKRAWRGKRRNSRCVDVAMYWNHWPCLIPQYGSGRKHLRRIALVPWQERIIEREREAFIRGLIHSDGCRIVANDRGVPSVRYHFSNRSEDIKKLFCDSLDALGINWTRPCGRQIAIYRQRSVEILDTFVGPKR